MFLVGLTGGIATGKSLVSSIFQEHGIPIIDADKIAREIVECNNPAYKQILEAFGVEILKENGEIDRAKLGSIIFTSVEKRKLLNKITHPYIYGEMRKRVLNNFWNGEQFIVLDLPLLFETRSVISYLYKTIVVSCDTELQLQRLKNRNVYSTDEAKSRIESQMPLEAKIEMADFVIENSGPIANTRKQTEDIIKLLRASKRHIRNRILICGSLVSIFVLVLVTLYLLLKVIFKLF